MHAVTRGEEDALCLLGRTDDMPGLLCLCYPLICLFLWWIGQDVVRVSNSLLFLLEILDLVLLTLLSGHPPNG